MGFFYPLKVNHNYLSEIVFEAEIDWKGMGYAWDYYLGAVKGACSREYWLAMAGEGSKEVLLPLIICYAGKKVAEENREEKNCGYGRDMD